jgi:hypothetical protein
VAPGRSVVEDHTAFKLLATLLDDARRYGMAGTLVIVSLN